MANRRNDSGYALMTVLFLITIFSVVALSVASQSFNSSKQNKIVEAKSQAIALAEMGVTYFHQAVENAYPFAIEKAEHAVMEKMTKDKGNKENWIPDETAYQMYAAEKFTNTMNDLLEETKIYMQDPPKGTYFHILPEGTAEHHEKFARQDGEDVLISFSSYGFGDENGKPVKLGATFTITMEKLKMMEESGNGSGNTLPPSGNTQIPNFHKIQQPTNVPRECQSTHAILNERCTDVLVSAGYDITGNTNNLNNKTIYATVPLRFLDNVNNMENIQLHSNGPLFFNGNVQNMTNSIIESAGTTDFIGHVKLIHSELHSAGSARVVDDLTANNRSYVYIGGNLAVEKKIELDGNSKICVRGKLEKVGDKIDRKDSNSKLYVWDPRRNQIKRENQTHIDNEQEWESKCGAIGDSESNEVVYTPIFQWGTIEQKVEYEY